MFCGSDYGPESFWNVCYPESELVVFPRNEMSSTELRRDLYGHWDWLPNAVKPYFVKKVLLLGGESVGKSTLSIHLANRFCTNYVEEAGRTLSEKSGTDLLMLPEDFTEILLQHKLNQIHAQEYSNKVLFVDTDALVTRFYMSFLEDRGIRRNLPLAKAVDTLNDYDLVLFLEPEGTVFDDENGHRSAVIAADRRRYSEQIKGLLRDSGRDFAVLEGDYLQRYETAVRLVENLLAQKE